MGTNDRRTANCLECGITIEYKAIVFAGREIKVNYCEKCVENLNNKLIEQKDSYQNINLFSSSNLPSLYNDLISNNLYEYYKHQDKGINFPIDSKKFPYMYGPPGTGKTFIASKIAYDCIIKYKYSVYFNSLAGFKDLKINDNHTYSLIKAVDILVIDDIGNHTITKFVIEMLKDLLDNRITCNKRIIITSNYNPIELGDMLKSSIDEESYDIVCDAISDRVLELCKPIKVVGDSIRKLSFIKDME